MAKKKKPEGKKGLDEWMGTYSDMVTLLMCFFVLLYAASTPNETKFQYIFQSFNSQGQYINPFVMEEIDEGDESSEGDGNTDVPNNSGQGTQESETDSMGLPKNFDELFTWIAASVENSEFSDNMDVSKASASRINIRLNNSIMFEGDSAVLLETGKKALRSIFPGIRAIGEYIKSIRVQGHTAQGLSAVNDWDLSSARACSVVKYMDYNVIVDSEKFITEGRAQYDPIADNSTEEGRQQNRRVEIIITRNDKAISDSAIIQDILMYDYGIAHIESDPIDRGDAAEGTVSDTVQQILSGLNDKYEGAKPYDNGEQIDFMGPEYQTPILEIPSSALQEAAAEEAAE